jgi:hypothetical protein
MSGGTAPILRDGQCARGDLFAMRKTPTIWLVLDGSGSMEEPLGDRTRWVALKEALMDPTNGVVKSLEADVLWGMVIYDGPLPVPLFGPDPALAAGTGGGAAGPTPTDMCPRLVAVDPKLNNYTDLNAVYPAMSLGGSTPTDKAIEAVLQRIPDPGAEQNPDGPVVQPTIVVLATDGAPNDYCGFLPENNVNPRVVSAVTKLEQLNIKTYVISLAGMDNNLTQALIQVAAAGGTGKPPFIPTNKADLVQVFKDIIGPENNCDVVLSGSVKTGSECMGKITVNGKPLGCNDANGWILKDPSTVTIQGTACTAYKADKMAQLLADFPCEAIDLN